jgi:hypothetical protein
MLNQQPLQTFGAELGLDLHPVLVGHPVVSTVSLFDREHRRVAKLFDLSANLVSGSLDWHTGAVHAKREQSLLAFQLAVIQLHIEISISLSVKVCVLRSTGTRTDLLVRDTELGLGHCKSMAEMELAVDVGIREGGQVLLPLGLACSRRIFFEGLLSLPPAAYFLLDRKQVVKFLARLGCRCKSEHHVSWVQ